MTEYEKFAEAVMRFAPPAGQPLKSGAGAITDLGRGLLESAWMLLVTAVVALVFLLRYCFTSPSHLVAWGRYWWSQRGQPAPAGRGGWWGHWWRHRRLMPDVAPDLGGLVQAPTGAGTLLLLPAPAARGPGPGRSPGRRGRRGK